jgi:ABC-2 type transport system permease protein
MSDARVHDVRFTRFDGELEGQRQAVWALARWSALRSMGARRSWKVKLVPVALTLVAFGPAIVVLGLRALFSAQIPINIETALPYKNYDGLIGLTILLFAAVITPELLCPDRRDRVLTLYFATALTRSQYVIGKILAAILPLLCVTLFPVWFLYAGNVLFADHPLGYVQDHRFDLLRITGAGIAIAVFYGMAGLAIASLTGRRAFAIGGYLAFMTVPVIVGGSLSDGLERPGLLVIATAAIPIHVAESLYPGFEGDGPSAAAWALAYMVVVLGCLAVLIRRYRAVEV